VGQLSATPAASELVDGTAPALVAGVSTKIGLPKAVVHMTPIGKHARQRFVFDMLATISATTLKWRHFDRDWTRPDRFRAQPARQGTCHEDVRLRSPIR
jgi:hypothetical protein